LPSFHQKKSSIVIGNFILHGELILKLPVEAFHPKMLSFATSAMKIKVNLCLKPSCAMESPHFLRWIKAQQLKVNISRGTTSRCETESALRN